MNWKESPRRRIGNQQYPCRRTLVLAPHILPFDILQVHIYIK